MLTHCGHPRASDHNVLSFSTELVHSIIISFIAFFGDKTEYLLAPSLSRHLNSMRDMKGIREGIARVREVMGAFPV